MKNPWFKFFVADWLSDRRIKSLSHAAKGVYVDLLCLMWQEVDGATSPSPPPFLPLEMEALASSVGMKKTKFNKVWAELMRPGMELFDVSGGWIFSRQLDDLHLDVCQKSNQNSRAAKIRWGRGKSQPYCPGEPSYFPVDNASPQMSIERLVDKWNEEMEPFEFRKALKATQERFSNFTMLKMQLPDLELGKEETWSHIFGIITESDYLSGRTERSRAVDIDFVLDPNHINDLLAGKYND